MTIRPETVVTATLFALVVLFPDGVSRAPAAQESTTEEPTSEDVAGEVLSPREAIAEALGGGPFPEDNDGMRWYRSNAEYMDLEPISVGAAVLRGDGGEPSASGYLLLVERRDDSAFERSILYRDDEVVGGERLDREERGRMTYRLRVDGQGDTILSERIAYRGDGTIRSVELCRGDGCVTARFSPPGPYGDETIVSGDLALRLRFDVDARPEYIRTERDGSVTEEFLAYRDGMLVERRIREADGSEITTTYRDGRTTREEETRSGRVVRVSENEYDSSGRIVRRVEESRSRARELVWRYGEDEGSYLLQEREEGTLVLQERVHPDGEKERILYRNGVAVLRETIVEDEVRDRQVLGGSP